MPEAVDVLVIGSGFAGLHCALETARAGRGTLVLDTYDPGFGASTRNMGHIGRYLHYPFTKLAAKFGNEKARAMWAEAGGAHAAFLAMLETEQMQVGQRFRGRFTGACSASHYDGLAKEYSYIKTIAPELEFWMCPKEEIHKEVESDYWHGALIVEGNGMLHPGRYHQAVLERAVSAGAQVVGHSPVTAITPEDDGFTVRTRQHAVRARDVVICTNGYTRETGYTPWTRRRIVPVPAHAIATAPMEPETLKLIKPKLRSMRDSKKNVFSDRPSPDDRVLIFSARTGHLDGDQRITAKKLHDLLSRVYPRLKETKISHCWTGMMGFPFDKLPHMGKTGDRGSFRHRLRRRRRGPWHPFRQDHRQGGHRGPRARHRLLESGLSDLAVLQRQPVVPGPDDRLDRSAGPLHPGQALLSGGAEEQRDGVDNDMEDIFKPDAFAGTVALITGATSGLGAETARQFAVHGASVMLVGRNAERGEALKSEIEAAGGTAVLLLADVSQSAACDKVVADTVERFDRVDILFNNAGIVVTTAMGRHHRRGF